MANLSLPLSPRGRAGQSLSERGEDLRIDRPYRIEQFCSHSDDPVRMRWDFEREGMRVILDPDALAASAWLALRLDVGLDAANE